MNDLIPLPRCQVSLTGIECPADLKWEEWVETLRKAVKVKEAVQWVVGGLLNFGLRKYVEAADSKEKKLWQKRYELMVSELPYEPETLRVYAYVDRCVSSVIRITSLSFRHHQAVAPLEPAKQRKYLQLAKSENLSVADLNEIIRENEAEFKGRDEGPKIDPGPAEWAGKLSLWCRQQDPVSWPKARREIVRKELQPVVDLYNQL